MSWTTYTDVSDRWVGGGSDINNEELVTALIADAETVILAEYPRIQERIDAGTLSLDVVKMVVSRMVSRIIRNPESLTYWQQNTGPFGQGRSFNDKDIWLTADEVRLLSPRVRGKAFEIDPAPNAVSPALDIDDSREVWEPIK